MQGFDRVHIELSKDAQMRFGQKNQNRGELRLICEKGGKLEFLPMADQLWDASDSGRYDAHTITHCLQDCHRHPFVMGRITPHM